MKGFEKMNEIKEDIDEMIEGRARKGSTEIRSQTKELQDSQADKLHFDFNIFLYTILALSICLIVIMPLALYKHIMGQLGKSTLNR
jgi:hypothetical protein